MPNNIIDPFSEEVMLTPEHIITENNVIENTSTESTPGTSRVLRVPRVPRAARKKFFISKELKKRLQTLVNTSENENAKQIAQDILNLKYETESGYNYLGLSNSDFTKISYMDNVRSEKYKDEVIEKLLINHRSKIQVNYTNWSDRILRGKPNLYARNFNSNLNFELITIKDAIQEHENGNVTVLNLDLIKHRRDELKELNRLNGEGNSFVNIDGETVYNSKSYLLKISTEDFNQLMVATANNRFGNHLNIYNGRDLQLRINGDVLDSYNHHLSTGQSITKYYCVPLGFSYSYRSSSILFIKPFVVNEEKVWDSNVRYHTKIGKIVRKIFPSSYNDVMITDFSEEYRKLIVINKAGFEYDEASGNDIATWYLDDNSFGGGTLGNSCMRYSRCQDFFDIYTKNSFVKLAILKYRNRVKARSLLWQIENKVYYDRIYYSDNDSQYILEGILKSKNYESCYNTSIQLHIPLALNDFLSYGKYPYLDTFSFYDSEQERLTNKDYGLNEHYRLTNTGGYYSHQEVIYECVSCHNRIDEDDLIIADIGEYQGYPLCIDCRCYIDELGEYTHSNEAVCLYNDEYAHEDDAIRLHNGEYASRNDADLMCSENGYGYFIYGDDEFIEIDDLYYHIDDNNKPEIEENTENTEINLTNLTNENEIQL